MCVVYNVVYMGTVNKSHKTDTVGGDGVVYNNNKFKKSVGFSPPSSAHP